MVQLVGDGKTGVGGGIGGGVQFCLLVLDGQLGIAGGGHPGRLHGAVGGIAGGGLGGQDIVQRLVCAVAGGKVIVAGVHNIGFGTVCVVGAHLALVHRDSGGDGLACGDVDLGKAHQFHRRLLDAVLAVIVGVGGLHVDLHRLGAVHRAGVGHIHREGEAVAVVGHGQGAVTEGGVAQAVAEGISHGGGVIIVAHIGVAQDVVLVAGLVVAVADVDALLVGDIVFVVAVERQAGRGCVGVGGGVSILDGR